MTFDGSRVLYLPSTPGEIKLVNLPHPLTRQLHNYLLCGNTLYELREVDGDNPHDTANYMRPLTKKDGLAVRSLILEGSGNSGVILENGDLIIPTRFNLAFILISYFTSQVEKGKKFSRFQSGEDLFDTLQEGIEGISEIPEQTVKESLVKICESVTEGDEDFYKYSEKKCTEYLTSKVSDISDNFPKSIRDAIVDPLLYPIELDEKIPDDISKLALQKYSIYLLSSYLTHTWTSLLIQSFELDPLENYINSLQKKKLEKRAAEENLADMNRLNAENKRSLGPPGKGAPAKKKAAPVKKQAPKVTRGPLDMLFKKK